MSSHDGKAVQERIRYARIRYASIVESTAEGLPNRRVLLAFPALLAVVFVALVGLGITGSSTGYVQPFLSSSADPDLIAGTPQAVRSDEWYVQTSWTISQVEQGLPITNESFPGGMDATVQHDLPSLDWSMAFRPHLLGFYFLPLDNAMAWKWWLPGFALIGACYLFMVSMLPRRPVVGAAVATGFFFAPFFQWWFLSITFWTAAWCFLVMTACIWLLRARARTPRVALTLLVGYLTVTMGMGIYVPFIVPAVLIALAFCIGFVLTPRPGERRVRLWHRLRSVAPLLLGGLLAVAVLGIWLITRLPVIERFLGTVYPGQRLAPPGGIDFQSALALIAAPMTGALGLGNGTPFAPNASEASTFFLCGLFLVVPFIWILVRDRRMGRRTDWLIVALLAVGGLIVAYLVVPGWDAIAHVLLLDRTTAGRIRLGLGLLSIVAIAVLARRQEPVDESERMVVPRWTAWLSAGLAALTVVALVVVVGRLRPHLLVGGWVWIPISILFVVAVYYFARGRLLVAALAFLVFSVIGSAGVNPTYRGVYDTNDTALGKKIETIDQEQPGAWVGVGTTFLPTVVLVQSGMESFNGFQSAPPEVMWEWIDPADAYEQVWNRLANITWGPGTGNPVPSNPAADQILVTFDSCSTFAQRHVEHVLSDMKLDQACLGLDERIEQGPTTFWVYNIIER